MATAPRTSAGPNGQEAAAHGETATERDIFAHTIPLLLLWLPMLFVVGLIILAGATTSHVALGGAILALLVMTYAVVNGTVRLASMPPERDGEEESEQQAPPAP